jgi:hypothetical protein
MTHSNLGLRLWNTERIGLAIHEHEEVKFSGVNLLHHMLDIVAMNDLILPCSH